MNKNTMIRLVFWQMTQHVSYMVILILLKKLFDTLNGFASLSGCKINMSKSEAIHIHVCSSKNSNEGLVWKDNTFRTLGVNFSL